MKKIITNLVMVSNAICIGCGTVSECPTPAVTPTPAIVHTPTAISPNEPEVHYPAGYTGKRYTHKQMHEQGRIHIHTEGQEQDK